MKKDLIQDICYPPYSISDQQWGLTITTVGYQSIPANTDYPTRNHPQSYSFNYKNGRILHEYQLVYISHGEGRFSSASTKEVIINEGSLFMLFPNEWHTYRPNENSGWNTFWIGFSGPIIDQLCQNRFFEKESPIFTIGFNEKMVGLFQEALNTAREERPGCQQLLAGQLNYLLGMIQYQKRNEDVANSHVHQLIDKARMLMKEHASQNISPEFIADQLNMGYSWFRRYFKTYTGISPGQYLSHLRLQQARELLEQTTMSIKEIAEQLHFESSGYFSIYFKRQTGVNPLEFRKNKQRPQK